MKYLIKVRSMFGVRGAVEFLDQGEHLLREKMRFKQLLFRIMTTL